MSRPESATLGRTHAHTHLALGLSLVILLLLGSHVRAQQDDLSTIRQLSKNS